MEGCKSMHLRNSGGQKRDGKFLSRKKGSKIVWYKLLFLLRNTWINGGTFLEYLDPISHNPQPAQDPDQHYDQRKSAAQIDDFVDR